nr:thioesterase family protein [uncultured Psychrobacter sp.]
MSKTENIAASNNDKTSLKPLFATDYHIYINHTDAGGIVYHANHLVFFENCRRDWFTKIGINGYFLQNDSGQVQHFVVSQAALNYRQAIYLDEIINVRIDRVELKPASIIFYQSIYRAKSNTLLSSAKIVIACVQNQLSASAATSTKADTNAVTPVANVTSIRPVRVPKSLCLVIDKAIDAHKANS